MTALRPKAKSSAWTGHDGKQHIHLDDDSSKGPCASVAVATAAI
jgi:hypothetical protein